MSFSLASLIEPITGLASKFIQDKDKAAEFAHDVTTLAEKNVHQIIMAEIKAATAVIVAEAKSEHKLTAQWRPITMLVFVAIIFNNHLLYPYMSLFWDSAPLLPVPDQLWDLLKIGLGGYVVGRSVEKAAKVWKSS